MVEQRDRPWLAPLLWLIAAVLAWTAAGVRSARGQDVNWAIAAAGLFWAILAVNGWKRWRASAAAATAASTHAEGAASSRPPDRSFSGPGNADAP